MSQRRVNIRLLVLLACVLVAYGLLLGRALQVQVIAGAKYRERAEDQHVRNLVIPSSRGIIYDRNGAELAISKRMVTVCAAPTAIGDPEAAAQVLAPILQVDVSELRGKLSRQKGFVYLARKVEPEVGRRVLALGLPGVTLVPEQKRYYPRGTLASQLLGYVGLDNKGLAGLEKEYESLLSGKPGDRRIIRDPFGHSLDIVSEREGTPGNPLVLTIDKDIQFAAEEILTETVGSVRAKRASAIVLDPRTGEVLAMANVPLYNANAFGATAGLLRRNTAVTDQYEPGSVFKIVVTAAALEAGLVTPETTFALRPQIAVADRTIGEAHGNLPAVRRLSVTQILAQSSNVGAITLGLKVGEERLVEMIRRFGFTRPTGVRFPGEAHGAMPPLDRWSGSTIGNIPMGQGISVTALQVAAAYAALANGGLYVKPRLVRDSTPTESHRVLSKRTADQVLEMLRVTVSEGTGKLARVEGYEVAGKTGTAEKAREDRRGYHDDRFVSSFVGVIPAREPRLVVTVVVDEPTTDHLASRVAAPAFSRIADFAVKKLEIAPDAER